MMVVESASAVVAIAASGFDVTARRIPNALTFGAMVAAFLYHVGSAGIAGALPPLGGAAVGLLLFLPLFLLGGMGAGDVKLLAALGAWLGPSLIVWTALYAAVAGGVLAIVVAVVRGYLGAAMRNLRLLLATWRAMGIRPVEPMTLATSPGPRLPYSLPIAAGLIAALWLH